MLAVNLCNDEFASVAAGCLKSRAGLDFSPALAPQGEKEKENPEKGETPVTVTEVQYGKSKYSPH